MSYLHASVYPQKKVSIDEKNAIFDLYQRYYSGANWVTFYRDLNDKDFIILLRDPDGLICGFSTIAVYKEIYQNQPLLMVYSGDTIIDSAYWGKNNFASTWLHFAGQLKQQYQALPMYWLLIVKGHRTYRYLSLFSHSYYPQYNEQTPSTVAALMQYLGKKRFGAAYNPNTDIILFPEPRSFLRESIASIPSKDLNKPEIQFFLQKNPGYIYGDELLCLCELNPNNLTRASKRWFLEGMHHASHAESPII